MNIMIDTNIYLSYFEMSKENIDPILELENLLKKPKYNLLLPEQVRTEILLNKSKIIKKTITFLDSYQEKLSLLLPPITKEWGEAKQFMEDQKKLKDSLKKLIIKYKQEATNEKTVIDRALKRIFKKAKKVTPNKKILWEAFFRVMCGKPPGKKNQYKDAVIWESILNSKYKKEELVIISNDGDWFKYGKSDELNPYLLSEWKEVSGRKISGHRSLAEFIKKYTKSKKVTPKIIESEKTTSERLAITENYSPDALDYSFSTALGDTQASGYWNDAISQSGTVTTFPPSMYTTGSNVKFCPYCGAKLNDSNGQKKYFDSGYYYGGYIGSSRQCPNCGMLLQGF